MSLRLRVTIANKIMKFSEKMQFFGKKKKRDMIALKNFEKQNLVMKR
jgi:hypothetical protein